MGKKIEIKPLAHPSSTGQDKRCGVALEKSQRLQYFAITYWIELNHRPTTGMTTFFSQIIASEIFPAETQQTENILRARVLFHILS